MKKNRNSNSYRFRYKFAFILFLSFLTNQKQEPGFQQVGGLVARNIFVSCLQHGESPSASKPGQIQ